MASQCKDCAERILLEKFCDEFDKFDREHVSPQEPYHMGCGVLYIEDASISELVVESLVSPHREVVPITEDT